MVTPPDIEAQILRYCHAEKWTVGTIARQLHVHHSVVRRVLAQAGLPRIGAPPPNSFPAIAAQLAHLIARDHRIRLAFASLGGWDTQVNQGNQKGQLANHLRPLGDGLAALAKELGRDWNDTVVLVLSEFGRTVHENAGGGTDHGHGNVVWVLGGGVRGGRIYGDWPGLGAAQLYQRRDLAITTDYRTAIAAILERHLRLDDRRLAQIFPQLPAARPDLGQMLAA